MATLSQLAARLLRLEKTFERLSWRHNRRRPSPVTRVLIGKTTSAGVSGRAGTTVGLGTVELWTIDDSGELQPILDDEENPVTVQAVNLAVAAVAGEVYVHLKQHTRTRRYLIDWEECGA